MTLKTSLIITGDASVARKEVAELRKEVVGLAADTRAAAPAAQALDKAQTGIASTARPAAEAVEKLGDAQGKAATTARELAQTAATARTAQTAGATAAREAATAQAALGQAAAQASTGSRALSAANDQVAASSAAAKQQLDDVQGAQAGAATGATAHATAAKGLQSAIQTMVSQIAGGATVFDAMADNGGTFAKALGDVAKASAGAKAGIEATAGSGEKAGVDLGGLGDTVVDTAGKVEGMGGKLGSVAAIIGGPWGAALGIGLNLLGGFASGLLEAAEDTDKLAKGSLSLVDALGKEKVATDAAREAIKAYNQQQEQARKNTELATRQALAKAEASIKEAMATRETAKAELEKQKAREFFPLVANAGATATANAGQIARQNALGESLKTQEKAIADLAQLRRNLLIEVGGQNAEAAADPVKGIDLKYDLQRQKAEEAAASNTKLARSIDQTVAAIERERAAKKKEYEDSQRKGPKPREVSLGNQIEAGSAAAILASAERYRGLSENRAGDRGQLADLFKQANVNIDPTMVAWCAAFVNSVLATNGVKGTGSLSARSFLGFGEKTDAPNKGDIVVSKRGDNPAQGHVGFYQGTDAKGRVLVLGGNTGDKVGTAAIARDDVLGFRRAPSAADSYATAQKAAADAAKEQQRDLDQIIAKYLPLNAAAKEYADELARIDALAKSYDGKNPTSGLTAGQADAARAALAAANARKVAELNLTPEAKAADDARKSLDGVVQSLSNELAARQSLDPVQEAMAKHQDELAKLSDVERKAYEEKLKTLYRQGEGYDAAAEAARAAADAQRYLRDMALDAFDAIAIGGENAGKVIEQLAKRIASAAIEAAVLGTGPLAALMKGGGTATSVVAGGGGSTGQAAADLVGKSVGKSVGDRLDGVFGKGQSGKIIQNAGFGYTAASITGGSGLAGGLGGAIGGQVAGKLLASTLGSFAGPLGSIAGGILGGVVGKLFSGKPKEYGSSTISFADGAAAAGSAIGKGSTEREKASALGGSVADGLNRIAEQLGGELGSANVSIGYRPGHKDPAYRVDTTGRGRVTGVEAFATEAEAIAFAIRDAITDGAVKGLSAAVQKALQSSTDVDKAVAEASKVQALETYMGGVTSTIDKAFKDFEATAKERVRLAGKYGFDLVAIEKRNGEDRTKLAAQLTAQQVGSLQKLIEELQQGSLFEGSGADKITAINASIAKAQTDLNAGVEGAGDTLADLLAKKVAASKDYYGTTGGYQADREATIDQARAAVAAANARIVAAQGAPATSDPALVTTNAALDENNDQNAEMIAALKANNTLLSQALATGGSSAGFNLRELAAY